MTRQILLDFVEFAETGARLVDRGRVAYDSDEMLRLAAEAILHRIGETVARLEGSFTAAHPDVSWRLMKGMRNIIAHEYGVVDHAIIWNALVQNLPEETDRVRRILDDL